MRLKKIKLAGFKSFVDQTTIELKGNVTAIVGPNGCGKSNVIDAVRWVMGESSAKQLRGLSMSDVIFNGSEKRKPIGMASIELIFDNSDASLGGEYAKYSEIAICRKVARDGLSDYYFNNTRCRRRDIVDIFLGTGLGPDSYAIIEQGTISQFVEAKPDELRVYLEEAAGISKYKERRRETEIRMKHTRENLARLNDIRTEVDLQLKHLKSQANAAERYKKLKQEEHLVKAQLHALHWRDLTEKLHKLEQAIQDVELKLEEKITAQRECEAKIVELREQHNETINLFNSTQERYYKVGANVARLEQQIHHDKERKKSLFSELTKTEHLITETLQHKDSDQQQIGVLQAELVKLTQEKSGAAEMQQKALHELQEAEQRMQDASREWDSFNLEVSKIERNVEVEHTKIQHLQQNIASEEQRIAKLRLEFAASTDSNMQGEVEDLERRQEEAKKNSDELHFTVAQKQKDIAELRQQKDRVSKELDEVRSKLQVLKGKSASLEALQQAALGQNDREIQSWLQEQKLTDKPRLVSDIKVESGWEKAVEVVLGTYLEAIAVDELNLFEKFPAGNLILFEGSSPDNRQPNEINKNSFVVSCLDLTPLVQKIDTPWNVSGLLAGVYVADSLHEAKQMRKSLESHESIITKDGIWVGKNWLCSNFGSKQKIGVLQRERELKELKKALRQEQEQVSQKERALQEHQALLLEAEKHFQELQNKLREATTALGKLQGELNAKLRHIADLRQRYDNLSREIQQHDSLLAESKKKLEEERTIWQEAVAKQQALQQKRQHFSEQKDEMQRQLNVARENLAQQRKAADASVMRSEMLQTQVSYLQQSQIRAEARLQDLKTQCENIRLQSVGIDDPLLAKEKELSEELAIRLVIENELQIAKQKVGEGEHLLRELEQKRILLQDESQKLRNNLENMRIEAQGLKTKSIMQKEQVEELNYEVDKLLAEINVETSVLELEDKLVQVVSKIERLGAINLAAIEEFEQQKQRKDYLETQNQDLVSALTMLENAIRKIDQETKSKFQEIFIKVNQRFQEMFPKIFNGGKALLQLVDENDVLTTGVVISAQPPGKRNSSIHLLSGGEKALTAVALIFAIFQLNPAPFCMLDEVDAPLDDSNVMRFCNLMKEMANEVQLIFISHNKLTLQIADQLTGVTMQEPGVSRIVAVDIDEALKMAEK